uniref:Uncharacterized protein n=1 Tax=Parascaris equorum TaxID=6256 RepID=A0A914R8R6_PAREQ
MSRTGMGEPSAFNNARITCIAYQFSELSRGSRNEIGIEHIVAIARIRAIPVYIEVGGGVVASSVAMQLCVANCTNALKKEVIPARVSHLETTCS